MNLKLKRSVDLKRKRRAKLKKHKSNLKLLRARLKTVQPKTGQQETSEKVILPRNCQIIPITPDNKYVLLAVNGDQLFKIHGQCKISSIRGCFTINGHSFKSGKTAKLVYAPLSHPAVSISVLNNRINNSTHIPDDLEIDLNLHKFPLNDFSVVILCQTITDGREPKVYPDYRDLYNVKSTGYVSADLCTGCWLCDTDDYFIEHDAYKKLALSLAVPVKHQLDTSLAKLYPVVITTGGKNVGKSTLNRYLINTFLENHTHVYYLECDIGQTEFTQPGLISINKIQKNDPILGPPFTHNRKPIMSVYYGHNNPVNNPDMYIKCVDFVCYKFFQSLSYGELDGPLVVNTMGWIQGLGLNLLTDTIRLVCPTHVFQLSSRIEKRNFANLTSEYVSKEIGWILNNSKGNKVEFEHILEAVEPKKADANNYMAVDIRNLSIYASFNNISNCYASNQSSTNSLLQRVMTLPTQEILLNAAVITNATDKPIKTKLNLAMVNASIVGLCSISSQEVKDVQEREKESLLVQAAPIGECLGIGIVKSVDPSGGKIHVITDVDTKNINCIIRGAINIPSNFILGQLKGTTGTKAPYITTNYPYEIIGSGKFQIFHRFSKFHGNKTR